MKKSYLPVVAGLLLSSSSIHAKPFDESKGAIFYETSQPIRKAIVPPQSTMSVDDYVAALSKTSNVNFIADVTSIDAGQEMQPFPASTQAAEGKWKPSFYNVLGDFKASAHLSSLRYDQSTYLLWESPDALDAAQAIIASDGYKLLAFNAGKVSPHKILDEYASNKLGWLGVPVDEEETLAPEEAADPPSFNGKLGDLPSDVREPVRSVARYALLRPELKRELLFSDDYWKTARVYPLPERDFQGRGLIYIAGQDEQGNVLPATRAFSNLFQLLDGRLATTIATRSDLKMMRNDELSKLAEQKQVSPFPIVTSATLDADEALQTKVSLDAKRRDPIKLLAEVAQRSGVNIAKAQEPFSPRFLVTAKVDEVPLSDLMGAFARLYGARWSKEGENQYLWHSIELTPLQKMLLQSGSGEFGFRQSNWNSDKARRQQYSELEQQVIQEVISSRADFSQGVSFASLPEDLQLRVRRVYEEVAADALNADYQRAWKFVADSSPVKLQREGDLTLSHWNLNILMADEKETLVATTVSAPIPEKQAGVAINEEK